MTTKTTAQELATLAMADCELGLGAATLGYRDCRAAAVALVGDSMQCGNVMASDDDRRTAISIVTKAMQRAICAINS